MPHQRQAETVLDSLLGVERELELTEPGSPEAEFLRSTAARLRNEYEELVEDVGGHGEPKSDTQQMGRRNREPNS